MKLHNRQIKASFWTDTEMILNFSLEERLFYIGLWQLSDDSGCLENDPYALKLFLFPLNDSVTVETLTTWIDKLIAQGKLLPYQAQGKNCLYLANFSKHQTLKNPLPPEVPLPPWITWKTFKSNPRTGRYEINDPPAASSASYSVLTPYLQEEIEGEEELNIKEEKEEEEEKDCQGKGETISADAESRSFLREEKTILKNPKTIKDPQLIIDFYNQEFKDLWQGPLRLTRERERQIQARLKTFSLEELQTAIINLRQSSFHCGANDKQRVYATPDYLFRNDSQVDKWLNEKPPTLNPDREKVWAQYLAQSQAMNDIWLGG